MKKFGIYTDGSHLDKQNNGRLGCGGILVDESGNIIKEFSKELTPEYIRVAYKTDHCSNPSAELLGILLALQEFKQEIKGADNIEILADYIGCKEWMTGHWKIKEPYIQLIKNDIDDEISHQELKGKITFSWVKGHSGDKYNDYVDKLAKGL